MWSERNNKTRKAWRQRTRNRSDIKYARTFNGMIKRKYMRARSIVLSNRYNQSHLYFNLSICSKEAFYKWALSDSKVRLLYEDWVKNDYKRSLSPSLIRINPKKGYLVSNLCWVTLSECASIANYRRWKPKRMKKVIL